jgi:hypothetical protein
MSDGTREALKELNFLLSSREKEMKIINYGQDFSAPENHVNS